MQADTPFYTPQSSFKNPVKFPGSFPTDNPLLCVQFNEKWLPYILGCLRQLQQQTTFTFSSETEYMNQQGAVAELIYLFSKYTFCEIEKSGMIQEEFMSIKTDCDCKTTVDCPEGGTKTLATTDDLKNANIVGGNTPTPPPNGGTMDYCKQFNANGTQLIPGLLNSGDTILLTSADGSGYDGSGLTWYCVDGNQLFGSCQPNSGHLDGTDPLPTTNHMAIVLKIGSTYHPIPIGSPFVVPGGVSNQQGLFQANTANVSAAQGSYSICYTVTNNQAGNWAKVFDLLSNSYGSYLMSADTTGQWIPGVGWETTFIQLSNGYRSCDLNFNFPGVANLTDIKIEFNYTPGTLAATGDATFSLGYDTGHAALISVITPTTPSSPENYGSPITVTSKLEINLMVGVVSGTGDPGGVGHLTQITLSGTGHNPF